MSIRSEPGCDRWSTMSSFRCCASWSTGAGRWTRTTREWAAAATWDFGEGMMGVRAPVTRLLPTAMERIMTDLASQKAALLKRRRVRG
jgi:hypothetical protein